MIGNCTMITYDIYSKIYHALYSLVESRLAQFRTIERVRMPDTDNGPIGLPDSQNSDVTEAGKGFLHISAKSEEQKPDIAAAMTVSSNAKIASSERPGTIEHLAA